MNLTDNCCNVYMYNICIITGCSLWQNGYTARRRSLVEDARFESLVAKQTKQNVLEEARQRSNGESRQNYFAFTPFLQYYFFKFVNYETVSVFQITPYYQFIVLILIFTIYILLFFYCTYLFSRIQKYVNF